VVYVGCDLGIVSAKAAVIDERGIRALALLPYKGHPRQAAVSVMEQALEDSGVRREEVIRCLSTGFGKKAVPFADAVMPSQVCLHAAVRDLNPKIRTVIDVGGHTFTAFNMDDAGRVSETAITDKCAAGTGMFIEFIAKALDMTVDELNEAGCGESRPVAVTSQCVVLAESEVISLANDGHSPHDIYAGVSRSVAARIVGLVRRIDIHREVAMVGGVARNGIIVEELERRLGLGFADLGGVDPQLVAALGAALVAREEASPSRHGASP